MSSRETLPVAVNGDARITCERASQRLVTAFVVTGMFFMVLPGTFWGVWNLISISEVHDVASLPQGWLQAHGQAQIFGWIGSFILGIGFYSLTKMQRGQAFPAGMGWSVWALWTSGVSFRWLGGVTEWRWEILLPFSAILELAAFLLFYASGRRHRPTSQTRPEPWIRIIVASTIAFLITMVVNCALLISQAFMSNSPALPRILDQQFVTLAVWGILVPTIWGFNARWLPIFAGFKKPNGKRLLAAYLLSITGVASTFLRWPSVASTMLLLAAIFSISALHAWERSVNPPKVLNVHPSFPFFVRAAYLWLLISAALALLAASFDRSAGLWGASRHALTVGFVAVMVFAIGQRVLPAFCGMRVLWSVRLMFWSLAFLSCGCLLRVASEPLAYGHLWSPAWDVLPTSAVMELTAVSLFALNMGATLLRPPAHLRTETNPVSLRGAA